MERVFAALAGWKGYALALALGLAFGAGMTWKVRDWMAAEAALKQARADLRGAIRVGERTQQAAEITQAVGTDVAAAEARVRIEYRTIVERIPVYVTAEADRAVDVPVGFVRLHDAAAAGSTATLPDRPGESVDAPSGVALSAVAGTVAGNYEQCHVWRGQVIGWQDWYAQQRKAWEAPD